MATIVDWTKVPISNYFDCSLWSSEFGSCRTKFQGEGCCCGKFRLFAVSAVSEDCCNLMNGRSMRKAAPVSRAGAVARSVRRGVAQEDQAVRSGLFDRIAVALVVEVLQTLGGAQALLDHVAAHQAAGFLGMEADDLVLAVFQVLERGVDDPGLEGLALDRAEVLGGGQVQQDVVALGGQGLLQPGVDALAPEGIEVLATGIGQLGAHFQRSEERRVGKEC